MVYLNKVVNETQPHIIARAVKSTLYCSQYGYT